MKRLALAIALVAMAGCQRRPAPKVLGTVPAFTLTDQTGAAFSSDALKGKVWVADFIYTTCQGPCPRMSAQMRQLQNATRELADLRFVSFTVDPEHDTPAALAEYARRFQADERWVFLTGEKSALHALSRDAFKLGDVSGTLEHSTRFVLVDARGRIRSYVATWEKDGIRDLIADVRAVREEKP